MSEELPSKRSSAKEKWRMILSDMKEQNLILFMTIDQIRILSIGLEVACNGG